MGGGVSITIHQGADGTLNAHFCGVRWEQKGAPPLADCLLSMDRHRLVSIKGRWPSPNLDHYRQT